MPESGHILQRVDKQEIIIWNKKCSISAAVPKGIAFKIHYSK
jgi:hypothetical protein